MSYLGCNAVEAPCADYAGNGAGLPAQQAVASLLAEIGAPWTAELYGDPYGSDDIMVLPADDAQPTSFVVSRNGLWVLARVREDEYRVCGSGATLAQVLDELRLRLLQEVTCPSAPAACCETEPCGPGLRPPPGEHAVQRRGRGLR